MIKLNRPFILKTLLVVWLVLWVVFLIREDKSGQYEMLNRSYRVAIAERTELVYGKDLYRFLSFCGKVIPHGASCGIEGLDKYSIDEVRIRYYLWPVVFGNINTDFKIVFRNNISSGGYRFIKKHGDWSLYAREDK